MSALLLVAFFIVNLPDMLQYAVSVGWSPDPAKNCTSTDSSYFSRAVLRFGSLYIFGRLGYIFGRLETNLLNSALELFAGSGCGLEGARDSIAAPRCWQ